MHDPDAELEEKASRLQEARIADGAISRGCNIPAFWGLDDVQFDETSS